MNHSTPLLGALLLSLYAGVALAAETTSDITTEATTAQHKLVYRFQAGEEIRYKVEHKATVDTTISGNRETTKSGSVSTKVWKVSGLDGANMEFTHGIEDVDMWQQSTGRAVVKYNSRTDEKVPTDYQHVAASIGKTLATVTINPAGQVIAKKSSHQTPDLGFGGIVVPLPAKAIPIGHTWGVPKTVKLKLDDGRIKNIKTRLRYRLEKVKTGVATISMTTQILTPVNDPRLKSQLVQKVSAGEVKFDMDRGRVISKRLDWDENVIGFNGPSSNMKYLARFEETVLDTTTARKSNAKSLK